MSTKNSGSKAQMAASRPTSGKGLSPALSGRRKSKPRVPPVVLKPETTGTKSGNSTSSKAKKSNVPNDVNQDKDTGSNVDQTNITSENSPEIGKTTTENNIQKPIVEVTNETTKTDQKLNSTGTTAEPKETIATRSMPETQVPLKPDVIVTKEELNNSSETKPIAPKHDNETKPSLPNGKSKWLQKLQKTAISESIGTASTETKILLSPPVVPQISPKGKTDDVSDNKTALLQRQESTKLSLCGSSRISLDGVVNQVTYPKDDKPKPTGSVVGNNDSFIQSAIPCLPLSLAVVCLIMNIFVPGSGNYEFYLLKSFQKPNVSLCTYMYNYIHVCKLVNSKINKEFINRLSG